MKILFLFPPQWMPSNPHFAIPSLLGQFKGTAYEACGMDLNIDFYNKILTQKSVSEAYHKAKDLKTSLYKVICQFYENDKQFEDYSAKEQNLIVKHWMIKEFFEKNSNAAVIPVLAEGAVNVLKSGDLFYNPKLFLESLNIINKALEIVSMPYYPTLISFTGFQNERFKLNFESMKYYVEDENTNIFLEYYAGIIDDIVAKGADYIGVSINSSSQIVGGLTLCKMLKERTKAHINIGGNFFGRVVDNLLKRKEFFDMFCDSISIEEGEAPTFELARHIAGEIEIEKVPNLLYIKDNKVVVNEKITPMKLDDMKPLDLDCYNLKDYFTPAIVIPFQTSRGCYWRKCSFCDHDFGMHYNIKNIDKLVEQIKMMKEKYGISKFEFIDEAISPQYMEKMAERFLQEDLNISFFCDARLESEFTKEILQKAHAAGLKMILWGLESGSRKIMELINKGIDIDNRLNVLRDSYEAGIFNFAFIFFGFPAETKQDAIQTIDMICENTDIINTYGKSVFTMGRHTKLREAPEKYGVVGETVQEDEFSPTFLYKAKGMTKDELNEILELSTQRAFEAYGNALAFQLISREIMLLYLDKYGLEGVCNYKFAHSEDKK